MECKDPNCPHHGSLATRGVAIEGVVTSDKMQRTVIVQKNYLKKDRKYERYRRVKSRLPAHLPACMKVNVGDSVQAMECRRLSKTVSFVITKKLTQ